MPTRSFVDADGVYLGGFEVPEGHEPNWPADAIEVPGPPPDGRMRWKGGLWVSPIAFLKALAGARRWEIETGGITLPGPVVVATDTVAQGKIDAALSAFERGVIPGTIAFKAADGFVDVGEAQLTGIYQAVVAHVQACYAAEALVVAAIEAGEITTADEVRNWPSWPASAGLNNGG